MTDTSSTTTANQTFSSRPAARLERDPNGVLGGVAAGVAFYFDVDVVLVRLLFVLAVLTAGVGPLAYLVAWLIIPAASAPLFPPQGPPMAGPTSGSYVV